MAFYHDVKSGIAVLEHIPAQSYAAGAVNGTAVDLQGKSAGNLSFLITAGTFGTSATLDAKVQWSEDNTAWTDEPAGGANDNAITQMTVAGRRRLHVPVPTHRYYRVVATAAVAAVVLAAVVVLGGSRHLPVAYAGGE